MESYLILLIEAIFFTAGMLYGQARQAKRARQRDQDELFSRILLGAALTEMTHRDIRVYRADQFVPHALGSN